MSPPLRIVHPDSMNTSESSRFGQPVLGAPITVSSRRAGDPPPSFRTAVATHTLLPSPSSSPEAGIRGAACRARVP